MKIARAWGCLTLLTGGLVAAPEPKVEMTVQLPPFIVEQPMGPRWRYLQIPRFEILSRCNDLTTEQLALAFHRANQLLGLVLPERLQLALDAPQGLIFYDQKLWPAAEQAAVAAMLQDRAVALPDGTPASPRVRLEPVTGARLVRSDRHTYRPDDTFFSNLMLADADAITTFALVSESTIDPAASFLTPAYVSNLLESRVPALPEWFIAGFMQLYGRMEFGEKAVTVKPRRWDVVASVREATAGGEPGESADLLRVATRQDNQPLRSRRAIELGQQPLQLPQEAPPQFRGGARDAETKVVEAEVELRLPLAALLEADIPAGDSKSWLEQAELIVSWGLDPANGRADAFCRWIDRAAVEPGTETLFQECLGLDYGAATRSLIAYAAEYRGIRWELSEAARLPGSVEDASSRQVARIKGEWERLEARYVRRNQPELEAHYVELARKTLRKSYDRGDRDPRLLASLGLLESEFGNRPAARAYLDEAARGGVVRSRAYYELARLRYDALVGRSTRDDGKFSAVQIEGVVEPLLAGMKQSPPLAAAYELLAHVSTLSVEPPTTAVLEALQHGARLFPQKRDRLRELATRR